MKMSRAKYKIKTVILFIAILSGVLVFPSQSFFAPLFYNQAQADLGVASVDIDYIVDPAGDYYSSGTVVSTNLLAGLTINNIDYFGYNCSIPANTSLQVMFSQDGSTWYSASHVADTYTDLADGSHLTSGAGAIALSGFNPEYNFYYKVLLANTDSGASTPTLIQADIIYNTGSYATTTTQSASSVTGLTATGNGNITNTGSSAVTKRGFQYGVSQTSGLLEVSETGSYGTGAYTLSLTNLYANTLYNIRSFIQNTEGRAYGDWQTFTTNYYYYSSGTVVSTNLLTGLSNVGGISGLPVTATVPAGATATAQFSQDAETWVAADGTGGTTAIADGTNTIDLSGLVWTGANFYYKIVISADGDYSDTPTLTSVGVNYDPANAYWVGGTGNWSDAATHWAASSGGAAGADNLPGATTNVYFDASSGTGTVTVDSSATVAGIAYSSSNITIAGNNSVTLGGPITLSADITVFVDTGNTFAVSSVISGGYNLTKSGAGILTLSGNNSTVGSVTISAGALALSGSTNLNVSGGWTNSVGAAGFTANTSTVTMTTGTHTLTGANTFYNLTLNASNTATFQAGTTQTIGGAFSCTGTAGNLITINSSSAGTKATLSDASGTNSCDYMSITDSSATGGAEWHAGANSTGSNYDGWLDLNTAPALTSVATSPSPIKGGSQLTITPTGQGDTESNTLYYYCNETGTAGGQAPTSANTLCSQANASYTTPYSTMTCTYNVSTGDATRSVYCRAYDGTDYSTERTTTYVVDTTAPSGGSVSYTNGYFTTASVPITYATGTDSGSGLNNSSGKIQRATATLTNGSCGSFGSFSDLHTGYNDSPYSDATVASGNCYMYQYLISDNVVNTATYTSVNVAKVDTNVPTTSDDYGAKDNVWQTGDQTITLTPADSGGSGIAWTKYCTSSDSCDPSAGTAYTVPVVISTGGTSYFRYVTADNAGNTQTTISRTIKINTAPAFSAIATSPDLAGLGSNITFTATASDADSGDTATLYVCKLNDFTGTACGAGGEWCHSSASASNPSCSYTILSSDTSGEKTYYGYIIDSHNLQSASNPRTSTFSTDIDSPTLSGFSPVSGSSVDTTAATISLTLSKVGDCRASTQNRNYDQMVSDTTCSGTQSITCQMPDVGLGAKDFYIACEDYLGNKNSSPANVKLSYILYYSNSYPSGGGGESAPSVSQQAVLPLIQQTVQTVVEQAQNIVSNVGNVITALLPQPKEEQIAFPPIEKSVPKETPDALSHKLDLVQTKDFGELDVSFLPLKFKDLVHKFPEIASTLEKVGITKADDVKKLNGVEFSFPGLSSVAGVKMPNDFIFATAADNKIDINMKVALTDKQEVAQSFNIISNRQINLVIKPQSPVKSVVGMVVLIPQLAPVSKNNLQKASASLLGSVVLAAELQSENKEIVLDKFAYTDNNNDGIYEASIQAPGREGKYEIRTTINYKNEETPSKQISIVAVVDPEGYIYREFAGMQARIKNAEVSIYWLNPETKQYEIWPAKDFQQENPQKTNETGKYSFLVPPGYYYLAVQADGYSPYKGKPFQVSQGAEVNTNIQLIPKNWLAGIFSVERILMAVIIALLILVIIILYFIKVKKIKTS